jgi:hypothetical protein
MKLFITTCLKEYQEDVSDIFKQAGISVFSSTEIIGVRENQATNMLQDWFASGNEAFDSLMIFSFTADGNASHGMELIDKYNEAHQSGFPVRAFIVPVEKSNIN